MKKLLFVLTFIVLLAGCDDNDDHIYIFDVTSPQTQYSKVQFNLQYGFGGQAVSVYIDSKNYFNANIAETDSSDEPQASFTASLARGLHSLIVNREYLSTNETFSDSSFVSVGDYSKYLGLFVENDTLIIEDWTISTNH